jgi:hypothetical protein
MGYVVALVFRDNVVHKLEMGDNLQVAQVLLDDIHNSVSSVNKTFRFINESEEVVFVANLDNFMFAFIEEKK